MWLAISFVLLAAVHCSEAFLAPGFKPHNLKDFSLPGKLKSKEIRTGIFTQWTDHFNSSDFSTFDQKIYINDLHYNLNGPVFIFVGSRLEEFPYWLESSFISQINEERFGVVYGIEPRFYGESRPTEDLSNENLRLLTIEQTIADLAEFTRFLRQELSINKYILYGYGDGAALATFAHQTYPQLFDGVWAVSAPVYIVQRFDMYYNDIIESLINFNRPCAEILGSGLEELDELVVAGDVDRIYQLFGLAHNLNVTNSNEVGLMFYTILDRVSPFMEWGSHTDLYYFCLSLIAGADAGKSAVESLAGTVAQATQEFNPNWGQLVDSLRATSWDSLLVESGYRQYWYVACSQRAFFQTSDSFPAPVKYRFQYNVFHDMCYDVFGLNDNAIGWGNYQAAEKFRLNPNLPNVIFTNGELDPFRLVGQTTDLNELSPAAVIPGFGKAFELLGYIPEAYWTPEFIAVRAKVRSHILSIIDN